MQYIIHKYISQGRKIVLKNALLITNVSIVAPSFILLILITILLGDVVSVKISSILAVSASLTVLFTPKLREYILSENFSDFEVHEYLVTIFITLLICSAICLTLVNFYSGGEVLLVSAIVFWKAIDLIRDVVAVLYWRKGKYYGSIITSVTAFLSMIPCILMVFLFDFKASISIMTIPIMTILSLVTILFYNPIRKENQLQLSVQPKRKVLTITQWNIARFSVLAAILGSSFQWLLSSPRFYLEQWEIVSAAKKILVIYLIYSVVKIPLCTLIQDRAVKSNETFLCSKFSDSVLLACLIVGVLAILFDSKNYIEMQTIKWILSYIFLTYISCAGTFLTVKDRLFIQIPGVIIMSLFAGYLIPAFRRIVDYSELFLIVVCCGAIYYRIIMKWSNQIIESE